MSSNSCSLARAAGVKSCQGSTSEKVLSDTALVLVADALSVNLRLIFASGCCIRPLNARVLQRHFYLQRQCVEELSVSHLQITHNDEPVET